MCSHLLHSFECFWTFRNSFLSSLFNAIHVIYLIKMLQVFSAFGFVHKIATFEKTAGFQVVLCEEVC